MEQNQYENMLTLRDYVRVFFRSKTLILNCFISVMVMVILGLEFKTPLYEGQVKMLISAEKQVGSPYYQDVKGYQKTEISLTQSEIVKSTPVLERTVKALQLHNRPDDYEKGYCSNFKEPFIDMKLSLLNRIKDFLKKFESKKNKKIEPSIYQKAMDDLRKNIEVEPIRGTNLFTITVLDFSPLEAAKIANVISRAYVIFDLEQQMVELQLKYGDKNRMVQQLRDNIKKIDEDLTKEKFSDVEAIGPASVKIIEQASVPLEPAGISKLLKIIIALFVALLLGIIFAFTYEYMDQTFKLPQDIEKCLGVPFLGSIPRKKLTEKRLIDHSKKKTLYNSFYQNLTDQFYLLIKDKKIKSISITAADEKGDIASIVANIGRSLSQKAQYKILLIDADFRNPTLQKLFKLKNSAGLADVLEDKVSIDKAINKIDEALYLLTAGQTELNPTILLDSPRIPEIIENAKKDYNLVIIKAPSLNTYQDTVVIASYTEGTVVTVEEGLTRRQSVQRGLMPLEQQGTKILGVILNNRTFPIPKIIYENV